MLFTLSLHLVRIILVQMFNELILQCTKERELLDFLEELRNHLQCINDLKISGKKMKIGSSIFT